MPAIVLHYTIPAPKAAAALAAFLKEYPNPTHDPMRWSGPQLSDADWLRYWHRNELIKILNIGHKKLDEEEKYKPPPYDPDFVEEG